MFVCFGYCLHPVCIFISMHMFIFSIVCLSVCMDLFILLARVLLMLLLRESVSVSF